MLATPARKRFIPNSRSFYASVALAEEARTVPNDSAVSIDDQRIVEVCPLAQSNSLPDGNFVVGVQFALHEYRTGRVISLWPNRIVRINESDRTEFGLLPRSSRELLACQFHKGWYTREPSFPILNRVSVNAKNSRCFRVPVAESCNKLEKIVRVHGVFLLITPV